VPLARTPSRQGFAQNLFDPTPHLDGGTRSRTQLNLEHPA